MNNRNSIELMVEEHTHIKRMLVVVRNACYRLLSEGEMKVEHFTSMIEFIRGYADAHHHGKEETYLFKEMQLQLGNIGRNLISHGMLVEHDLGRLHIKELEQALVRVSNGDEESKLDVIGHAIGYVSLLTRHIAKEDDVVYPYGKAHLSSESMLQLEEDCANFEEIAEKQGIQSYYLAMLETLETQYG